MSEELSISLRDRLRDIGVNDLLIDELVSAAVRVNYGQVDLFIRVYVQFLVFTCSSINIFIQNFDFIF